MTHLDLSDEQSHALIDLFAETTCSLDDLPYTEEFEQLYRRFLPGLG
jgi:hypothetical protein